MKKNEWLKTLALAAAAVLLMLFLLSGGEKDSPEGKRDGGPAREDAAETALSEEEDYAEHYFRAVTAFHPGTAGASLGRARAACDALRFAAEHRTGEMESEELHAKLRAAWDTLSAREQEVFTSNFVEVMDLVRSSSEDWQGNRGLFDDAGVLEETEALLKETSAQEHWDALCAETLKLGEPDESGD